MVDCDFYYLCFFIDLSNGGVTETPVDNSRTFTFYGDRFYQMKAQGLDIASEEFFVILAKENIIFENGKIMTWRSYRESVAVVAYQKGLDTVVQ